MIRAKGAYNGQIFRMQLEPSIRLEDLLLEVCFSVKYCFKLKSAVPVCTISY